MSDRIIDTIAETLGRHRLEHCARIGKGESFAWWECLECGWKSDEFEYRSTDLEPAKRAHQADAIVAALKAQHIAVVPLPQPDKPNRWDLAVDRVIAEDGQVVTGVKGLAQLYDSPKMARERAAALLAAAAAAEAVTNV